ncbi:hypothetical protein PENTCL1PPCAC_15758, partial [Pristionchus entomophagus]
LSFPMSTDNAICRVCSTPSNSTHFGIQACRACASFFKRTVISGRKYPCRSGLRRCEIAKYDKFTCRRCRYDKCVAAGMVYEGLMRVGKKVNEQAQEFHPDTNLPSTSKESLLDRIGKAYEQNIAKRQERELTVLRQCSDAKRIPHLTQELYSCNPDFLIASINMTIQESWSFFHSVGPSFKELVYQEQMDLYRFYLPIFTVVDSYIRTWKLWESFDTYSMCSVSVCMDLHAPDTWLNEKEGGCNRDALLDSMSVYVRDQMAILVPSLKKAKMTDREVYGLLALMLCEIDMKMDVSERLLSQLDSIRSEALHDLQRYYKEELGLSDFSARLGNLMTICHAVRECNSHFQSFFRMQVTLFDLWKAETQLKEMFL